MTVQGLINALMCVKDKTMPVLICDTRSGVVDEPRCSGSPSEFSLGDSMYGVDLPLGTPFCPIYLG